jgi:WD40 repeat protein/transcriptional regulator with XRE-family HTH domain
MPNQPLSPESFETFGDLLKFLRRREQLTQLELSIAVGYSEGQISRLEQNQRLPDLTALKALFIPALHLENEPELAARFLVLARTARQEDTPAAGFAPYKGLLFFDQADADLFFGREALTAHLVERVTDLALDASSRFLAVVGASGSGKSSLVRAGLAVALGRLGWEIHIFTPTANPLKMLTASTASPGAKKGQPHLVLVDQFEETFTLCRDENERAEFFERLISIAREQPARTVVVIALRADFYSHCAQYPLLRAAVAAEQEYIGQMTTEELRRAIEEPARRGGWEFEPGLVDILLSDIGADGMGQPEPGALPLLSHALLATWERRRGRTFTLQGYHASGGVRGAIAETAESVFTDQLNQAQQTLARNIFLRLTELGEGTEDTRRRATLNELAHQPEEAIQLRAVLNTLAEARLITINEDSAEVAHEALIREWQRLHEWLSQDREGLLLHRHLTDAALEWQARGQDAAELYRGARLAQVREWAEANPERLNPTEQAFIAASIEREQHDALEREAQRQRELEAARKLVETQAEAAQRLRRRAVFLSLAVVIAIGMALAAISFGQQSNHNANLADQNLSVAQSASTQAVAQQSTAESASLLSQARKATAEAASTQAVGQSNLRATSEADTVQEAAIAESRALSAEAMNKLSVDHQLSLLLALQAIKTSNTNEAQNALHQVFQASRLRAWLPGPAAGSIPGDCNILFGPAFSPLGDRFAVFDIEGNAAVKIWKMGDSLADIGPTPLITVTDPITLSGEYSTNGNMITFSPDGSLLASMGISDTAKVWDARTGDLLHTLEGHTDLVNGLFFSPDGRWLATTNQDRTVKIWDVKTGQVRANLTGHTGVTNSAVFSPDGRYLVTGSADQTAIFWDLSQMAAGGQPRPFYTLSFVGTGTPGAIAFTPDGKRLAIGAGKTGYVYELDFSKAVPVKFLYNLIGHQGDIHTILFSPDGKRLVTAAGDNTPGNNRTKIWDAETGLEQYTLAGDTNYAALSPDGNRLITASCRAQIWDVSPSGNQELFNLPGSKLFYFSLDGKRWLSVDNSNGVAQFWEPSPTGLKPLSSFKFDPGDPPLNSFKYDPGDPDSPKMAVPDRDLKRLVTVGARPGEDMTARVWDTASGQEIFHFSLAEVFPVLTAGRIDEITVSPDGTKLVVSSSSPLPRAAMWDLATGELLKVLEQYSEYWDIWSVDFSPDGTRLATGAGDGVAHIYDVASGTMLQTVTGSDRRLSVRSVDFNQDGTRLVTGSVDGKVMVWDPATGLEIGPSIKVPCVVVDVKFNPDGTLVAAGCADSTAHVLDISTGQELFVLTGVNVGFSPDGKYLLTTADGITHGFYLDVNDLVALAQKRLFRTWTTDECQKLLHTQTCPPAS